MSLKGDSPNSPLHVSLSIALLAFVPCFTWNLCPHHSWSPWRNAKTMTCDLQSYVIPNSLYVVKSHGYITTSLQWFHWDTQRTVQSWTTQKHRVFYSWLQKREPGKFQIWEEFASLLLSWRLAASSSKGTAESCPTLMAVRKPALNSSCKEPNPINNLSTGCFFCFFISSLVLPDENSSKCHFGFDFLRLVPGIQLHSPRL